MKLLSQPDPKEDLRKLVDPMIGNNYPLAPVFKIESCLINFHVRELQILANMWTWFISHVELSHLAKICTQHIPQFRSIVITLITL